MDGFRLRGAVLMLTLFGAVVGFGGCGPSGNKVQVSVVVDFGPAWQPQDEKTVVLLERSTVFEALRAAFPVATSGR
jgi:hypothetical protein